MRFGEKVGEIDIDTSHLKKFLEIWCEPDDIMAVVGIPVTGIRRVMSFPITAKELSEQTDETIGKELCKISTTGDRVNLYIQMNPVKSEDVVTLFSRGKKEDIKSIFGCFIDLDVGKQDAFDSKKDIYEFLHQLGTTPTMVIDNGESGGLHAYWKFTNPVDPESSADARNILVSWWCYISEQAEKFLGRKVKIDKLVDITRISRLPSAIYWPREGQKFGTITVSESSGVLHEFSDICEISKEAFSRFQKRRDELRSRNNEDMLKNSSEWWKALLELTKNREQEKVIKEVIQSESDNEWGEKSSKNFTGDDSSLFEISEMNLKIVSSALEEFVNVHVDWTDILEPYGWTLLRTKDSSRVWARPGRNERSAETDYNGGAGLASPTMSLLSTSEETGLADLKEADIKLTKSRVMLRLHFNDDFAAYLTHILKLKRSYDESNQ